MVEPGPDLGRALRRVAMSVPRPAPGELLLAVDACGVCRTDLHVTVGELPVHRAGVVPGHEIVGHVLEVGSDVTGYARYLFDRPRRGLLGRSARYDLLPLSHA